MYVYVQSEPGLWTVGFYHPGGKWEAESDHRSREEAAKQVHYLNGGASEEEAMADINADSQFETDR